MRLHNKRLHNIIRYWRLQTGIRDLEEFAELIGFSPWLVERWEQQVQPTLEALCQIKERLLVHNPGITLEVNYKVTSES